MRYMDMAQILLWTGIGVTVAGWLALAWQATRRMTAHEEMQRFPEFKARLRLRRRLCLLAILAGCALIVAAMCV